MQAEKKAVGLCSSVGASRGPKYNDRNELEISSIIIDRLARPPMCTATPDLCKVIEGRKFCTVVQKERNTQKTVFTKSSTTVMDEWGKARFADACVVK